MFNNVAGKNSGLLRVVETINTHMHYLTMLANTLDWLLAKVKTEEEKRLCELLVEILVNRLERPVMQQLGSHCEISMWFWQVVLKNCVLTSLSKGKMMLWRCRSTPQRISFGIPTWFQRNTTQALSNFMSKELWLYGCNLLSLQVTILWRCPSWTSSFSPFMFPGCDCHSLICLFFFHVPTWLLPFCSVSSKNLSLNGILLFTKNLAFRFTSRQFTPAHFFLVWQQEDPKTEP